MIESHTTGTDRGYTFQGPRIVHRTMPLANGLTLEAYRQSGVVVAENPASPLYHATVFVQGTAVLSAEGERYGDAQLYEFIRADGDIAWACGLNWTADSTGTFRFASGIGRWQGIAGIFDVQGRARERADDHAMFRWEASWYLDPELGPGGGFPVEPDTYTIYDTGYSFHGPHVTMSTKALANGIHLVANSQSGVLISENPKSPRHDATCYDRGTTIQSAEGKALGDVMLLEDTDADGDVVWLYHEWWYGKGPGIYRFIGGTGKWSGIVGAGQTLGMVTRRADDHYMPTWEMRWRIDR